MRPNHQEIVDGIKACRDGEQATMDKAFPPILDAMKVHVTWQGKEIKTGYGVPKKILISGDKSLDRESYLLMPAMMDPPSGQLVLMKGESYIINSVVGYNTPSDSMIYWIAKNMDIEETIITNCVSKIFNNSKYARGLFEWGKRAFSIMDNLCEEVNLSRADIASILRAIEYNFEKKEEEYTLGSGFAIQAMISEAMIYPMLRKAKGSEKMATRKRIYPNKRERSFLQGQRTEVWPVIKPIYTEQTITENYIPSRDIDAEDEPDQVVIDGIYYDEDDIIINYEEDDQDE